MKVLIKKIDHKYLRGSIKRCYQFFYHSIRKLVEPSITPLRKGTENNYGLLERLNFFRSAQYFLQVNRVDGVYLEFGSHELNTFRMALNTLGAYGKPNKISKFIAFDSFEGMPEPEGIDRQKIWKKSMNFTSLDFFYTVMRKDLHRVEAVKGFYENTLPLYQFPDNQKIALAYIDCDYYSSTVEVLNFLKDKLSHGTILGFDDWDCYYADPYRGQRLAFAEFKKDTESHFHYEEFRRIGSGGMSFVCLEKQKMGQVVL
jgi:hypothetical protein